MPGQGRDLGDGDARRVLMPGQGRGDWLEYATLYGSDDSMMNLEPIACCFPIVKKYGDFEFQNII
jgi:hypothetical protein